MTALQQVVLLTGATGFVGRHLAIALTQAGATLRCASRDPERARTRAPQYTWCALDLAERGTIAQALEGAEAAYYLVHGMQNGRGDYPDREARAAEAFVREAERAGIERIVYLGGVAPKGRTSKHLASRLRTGEILRGTSVPAVELRAAMILGPGSASWRMVRDLVRRLPAMILPKWLRYHSWPIAIDDVVYALLEALRMPESEHSWFDIPGPERLSHRDVLRRAAAEMHRHPMMVGVPMLTPALSSYWIGLVTDLDLSLATELVHGLQCDLDPSGAILWDVLPPRTLVSFDEAVRSALADEQGIDLPCPEAHRRMATLGAQFAAQRHTVATQLT